MGAESLDEGIYRWMEAIRQRVEMGDLVGHNDRLLLTLRQQCGLG
jgi:hypothetical protein